MAATEAARQTVLAVRPQPLGVFRCPGYLLIRASPATEGARMDLLAGRLPDWPEALRAPKLASAGDREGALSALEGADPVSPATNRFVMDPDSGDPDELRWN